MGVIFILAPLSCCPKGRSFLCALDMGVFPIRFSDEILYPILFLSIRPTCSPTLILLSTVIVHMKFLVAEDSSQCYCAFVTFEYFSSSEAKSVFFVLV